jgi:hypothetical protein
MNWIIGDVHGKLDALKGLVDLVTKKDHQANFHFVGDYVDRGENSAGVVDFILALGSQATTVRGNHDDVFDTVINGPSAFADSNDIMESVNQLLWFSRQGMLETLESYNIPHNVMNGFFASPGPEQSLKALDDIRACIPQSHKDFFKNLPLVNEQETFFTVHAYLPFHVEENIDEWQKGKILFQKEMLWGRFSAIALVSSKRWKKRGYFGHSPTFSYIELGSEIPIKGPNICLVDTGCVFEHSLTAYCHEEDNFIQVDSSGQEIVAS